MVNGQRELPDPAAVLVAALAQLRVHDASPVIGTVMRQGYKLGDHILRHALVGVIDTVPDSDTADETGGSGSENTAANAESNE